LVGLLLMVLLFCSSCEKTDKHESIHWQLPLQSSNDIHSSRVTEDLPPWASLERGQVVLTFLHRNTAKVTEVSLSVDDEINFSNWTIRLLGLAKGLRIQSNQMIDDDSVHNPAAFIELSLHQQLVYRGWLYLDFPELFGLDNPNWKVWLKDVTFREISEE